ncbi:MAG TPA: hypothetical protein VM940_07300 [Chthoniobacterales bacterium]|jgi:hypothetical protein|nr:hypothetical protein [Chthoniobacterales bacterium]
MTATVDAQAPSGNRRIRIALIVIAAIQALGALWDIPGIFYDFNPTTPLGKFAQTLGKVDHVLALPLTFAALYFAIASRLRPAIAAIAIRILVTWLCDLPSIGIHGIEWSLTFGGIQVAAYQIGAPIIALAALYLARRNERLGLATLLVALPTILFWLGVLAFAVSAMIYGF